jgi:putative PIN family toxin of toxin-antitoxin system
VTIVVDTNVVVSAAFWPKSEDRRCFVLLARRKCRLAVTEVILDEYRSLAVRIGSRECPDRDPAPFLDWIERVALLVEPSPLGKRRSRDVKDDPFLACALACRAEFIVTKDKDLLALKKPFGVDIVTPRDFYRKLES